MSASMLGRLPWRSAKRINQAAFHQHATARPASTSSSQADGRHGAPVSEVRPQSSTASGDKSEDIHIGTQSSNAQRGSQQSSAKESQTSNSSATSSATSTHGQKPLVKRVVGAYELSPRLEQALKQLERKGFMNQMLEGRVPDLLPPDLHAEWQEFAAARREVGEAETKPKSEYLEEHPRLPRNLLALYLQPLRKEAKYGIPTCDLQMRSYNAQNLLRFTDFALRAAYYCNLPAYGPIPLPKIIERWTVPRAHFIHKKQQENFERITRRRLIQIKDGHPASIQLWLSFLKRHAIYGVGMKANLWEFSRLDVAKEMDKSLDLVSDTWSRIGRDASRKSDVNESNIAELINTRNRQRAYGLDRIVPDEQDLYS